jgi:hypothetical protein
LSCRVSHRQSAGFHIEPSERFVWVSPPRNIIFRFFDKCAKCSTVMTVDLTVVATVGLTVVATVGLIVGANVVLTVGATVGLTVGATVGLTVGATVTRKSKI